MQNKYNTDIDRKLAVYYHPLFQQILTFVSQLFNKNNVFQLGLLQFLQFNLKLQKSLLPTFKIENAIVSGLNDWVKQVAECLSFDDMVSTSSCIQITQHNIGQLITSQIHKCKIPLLYPQNEYKLFIKQFYKHDAFRLLGVTINHEVFCKFLFDLCSTWCQFLDIELFSSFLLTLILQMTQGQTLQDSRFKQTLTIGCINIEFSQNFENDKQEYSLYKKKQLRYYRAWCEWNYLRMVEIGQKIIVDLNSLFSEDPRISKISLLFETSINTINQEVTLQAKGNKDNEDKQNIDVQKPKQFLIFKKLQTKSNTLRQEITFVKSEQIGQPEQRVPIHPNQFEIQIDQKGFMYLKPIIRMPIIGTKIELRQQKPHEKKMYLLKKQHDHYRLKSNLYCHTGFHVSLRHQNYKTSKPLQISEQIKQKFYKPGQTVRSKAYSVKRQSQIKKQSSKSMYSNNLVHQQSKIQSAKYILQKPEYEYIHQVMAPTFITGKNNNMSYMPNNYEINGNQVYHAKRDLQYNFPKIMPDNKKLIQGKHVIGKFLTDRAKIRERVFQQSYLSVKKNKPKDIVGNIINQSKRQQIKYNQIKESNKHIWSRYITQDQMNHLNDYNQFYQKLLDFKRDFSNQFRSDYMNQLKLDIAYHDSRYQMGGVYSKEDKERFIKRISKLIARDDRRKRRMKRKRKTKIVRNNKSAQVNTKYKNAPAKQLFNYVFIDYHREKIKQIRHPFNK